MLHESIEDQYNPNENNDDAIPQVISQSPEITNQHISNIGGNMRDNEHTQVQTNNPMENIHRPYSKSKFTEFLNIAYPVGVTILTSTSLGFGLYETLIQFDELSNRPDALGSIAFSAALMSALLLMALFHGYKSAIIHEYQYR